MKKLFFPALFLVLFGCVQEPENEPVLISFPSKRVDTLTGQNWQVMESRVVDISTLKTGDPLQLTLDSLPQGYIDPNPLKIERAYVEDDMLFALLPTSEGRRVMSIQPNGDVLTYGNVTSGTDLFTSVSDFTVQKNATTLLGGKGRIGTFTADGQYEASQNNSIDLASSFIPLGNSYLLYSNAGRNDPPHRLWWISREGEVLHAALPVDSILQKVPISGIRFWKTGDLVTFTEVFSNIGYTITGTEVDTSFIFDFGEYDYVTDFYQQPFLQAFKSIRERGFITLVRYLESPDREVAYFFLESEIPGQPIQHTSLFYHRPTQKQYVLPSSTPYSGGALTVTENGQWICPKTVPGPDGDMLAFDFVELGL